MYIPFSQEQREQARQTDLAAFLHSQGETLRRSGSEQEWRDGGQKVTIRGNLWFHQYDRVGGDAVDFVRRFYHKTYPEAVAFLLGSSGGQLVLSPPVPKDTVPFVLPPRSGTMRRVYGYLLRHRGIDREVLDAFVQRGMLYESGGYHNAVFVGLDPQGQPRHAHKRGTISESAYKGNVPGSRPEYSFHWMGTGSRLYLFEAPIDLLSFLSLHPDNWQRHSYAAACSVSDKVLFQCLKDNPNIRQVFLCLDSDAPGQAAARRIATKLAQQGIQNEILVPTHKDWNEDLLHPGEMEEGLCPALQF